MLLRFGELEVGSIFIFAGKKMKKIDDYNAITLTERGKQYFLFQKKNIITPFEEKEEIKDVDLKHAPPFNQYWNWFDIVNQRVGTDIINDIVDDKKDYKSSSIPIIDVVEDKYDFIQNIYDRKLNSSRFLKEYEISFVSPNQKELEKEIDDSFL